jgi:uncharacterized protein (TIGR00661 family)
VKKWQTLLQNVTGAVSGWPQNVRKYFELAEAFKPEVVISDFETFSYLFAKNHFLPVVSIDNMQVINRCTHPPELLAGHEDSFEVSRSLVKAKLPGAFHYLVTTFFQPPIRKERTTLVPPILRPDILKAKTRRGDHLLVYQTATTNQALLEALKETGLECRVYGVRRDIQEEVVDGNLRFRPFSESGFIGDLSTARAVIAGGGFTLMSEAVYLHKPVLSLPVEGQFEQVLNALYLEKLGYGLYARALDAPTLRRFLDGLPRFEQSLADYRQEGNEVVFRALDEQLRLAHENPSAVLKMER